MDWTKIPATPTVLRGERVVLRPPRPSDKRDRLAIGRHLEFVCLVGGEAENDSSLTEEDVEAWYISVCSEPLS